MINWPENLPSPLVTLSGQVDPGVIVNEMESGDIRQRTQYTQLRTSYNISIIVDRLGLLNFRQFHARQLFGGSARFNLPLPESDSIDFGTIEGIMSGGRYSFTAIAAQLKWRIEFTFISEEPFDIANIDVIEDGGGGPPDPDPGPGDGGDGPPTGPRFVVDPNPQTPTLTDQATVAGAASPFAIDLHIAQTVPDGITWGGFFREDLASVNAYFIIDGSSAPGGFYYTSFAFDDGEPFDYEIAEVYWNDNVNAWEAIGQLNGPPPWNGGAEGSDYVVMARGFPILGEPNTPITSIWDSTVMLAGLYHFNNSTPNVALNVDGGIQLAPFCLAAWEAYYQLDSPGTGPFGFLEQGQLLNTSRVLREYAQYLIDNNTDHKNYPFDQYVLENNTDNATE